MSDIEIFRQRALRTKDSVEALVYADACAEAGNDAEEKMYRSLAVVLGIIGEVKLQAIPDRCEWEQCCRFTVAENEFHRDRVSYQRSREYKPHDRPRQTPDGDDSPGAGG